MKKWILLSLVFLIQNSVLFAQKNYPKPPQNANRLFYIQHNQNTNTFVYDVLVKNGKFVDTDPVDIYRILYAEDGSKKEITNIQRKLAYGIKIRSKNSQNITFNLNGYPTLTLKVTLKNNKPETTIVVNGKNITVEKMFIQTKEKTIGSSTKVEYILISGKNDKNQLITEKFIP